MVTGACVFRNAVAAVVGNPLVVRSAPVTFPPDTPPIPAASAAANSATGLATCVGELALFHQLFTVRLNLSPDITFKIIAGPIFCKPAAAPTFATMALPGGVFAGYPVGTATLVDGRLL